MILDVPAFLAASAGALPELSGVAIAVDAADPSAADAVHRTRRAGATTAIRMRLIDSSPERLLAPADILVITGVSADPEAVFAVRTLATTIRARRGDVEILVEGPVPDEIRPYIDEVIEAGPLLRSPSLEELVAASLQGSGARRLIRLEAFDWDVVARFATERAVGTEVSAAGGLTAEAIVARHQAQRRRQEALVARTIARGTTTLLFEVPGFAAPVTVSAHTVVYRRSGVTEMEQRDIRVNGAAVTGGSASSPPRLPLIEAERVATPPLTITLDEHYRYSLAGRAAIGSTPVFVVAFEPRSPWLARGRAWIETGTFALRRLETVQTGLRGAIVSSEQQDDFEPFDAGGERVWLPVRTRVYQMYEGAGHRTPIHRVIETPEYAIDPADFDRQLRTAYASPHVMLRETPHGFRYLLRDAGARDGGVREVAPRAGERIRTAVFGVLVDPGITVPLPFAGLSYVDMNLFGTGAQLNAFFGGTYGQLSWSTPALGGTAWRAHGRAFAIAASYNDRVFRGGVEQYRENIVQRPAHASAGVVRPLTRRLRARLDYEFDYTAFDRADTTAADFVIPPDAVVHGLRTTIETESGPWTAMAWWNAATRQRWPDAEARAFQRFGVGAARTLALGRAIASRVEAAWMNGDDLDRFSRYSFGAFENRLRGYPTATIRYDRGGIVRTATTWAARGIRIDAFADAAAVEEAGFSRDIRFHPGVGAAVELGGPKRTLWSVEWGYGIRARRSGGGLGTHAVRITGFRVF